MLTTRPRGTNDILPGEVEKWYFIERLVRRICTEYGYSEIRTPIFEHTELFLRGVGDTTDIVEKEMYTFTDRGGRSITLRPENTAPVVRAYLEDKLYTATSNLAGNYTRCRAGVYILDMATDLYSLVLPPADWMNATMGAIYQTSTPKTFVSYSSSAPVAHYLCELKNDLPTHALLISEPFGQGATKKTAEYVLLALQPLATKQSLYQVFSVDIAVKLANVKRQLWAYALTNAVSAAKNQLAINGTGNGFGNAMVGDEVTILTGSNTGHVRHIKTISNQNTATEVWTFDAELPNLTENGTHLSVQPFQLIKKKTISNADITVLKELEDILYPVTNKIAGRRFLLKVVLSSMSDQPLTIPALSLIYNDNGTI